MVGLAVGVLVLGVFEGMWVEGDTVGRLGLMVGCVGIEVLGTCVGFEVVGIAVDGEEVGREVLGAADGTAVDGL